MSIPTPSQLKKQLDEKKSTVSETQESTPDSAKTESKTSTVEKKPFVMPEHLTQRPFSKYPGLVEMREALKNSQPAEFKKVKRPVSGKSAVDSVKTNSNYGKKINKENN